VVGVQLRRLLITVLILVVLAIQPLASAAESTRSTVYRFRKTLEVPNNGSTAATNVLVTPIYLLDNRLDYAGQQVLSEEIRVDGILVTPGVYSESSTEDNRVAQISLGTIVAGGSKTITITQIVRVDHIESVDPTAVQGNVPSGLSAYTQPVDYLWESDDNVLKNKALELISGQSNLYYQAKAIFDFVENYLTYVAQTEAHSALWAYNNRVGDCSEFTHLFSALCRAAGIPTRFVSGFGYDSETEEATPHAFAFIYLPGVGWAPVDLTWNRPEGMFGELTNDHLISLTSDGSNLVDGTQIGIPGDCGKPSYSHIPPDPDLSVEASRAVTRVVAVEPTVYADDEIEDGTWRFTVKVVNEGSQSVSDVSVELQVDDTYFEAPPAENIGDLGAGLQQYVYFDVVVKQSAESSPVTAVVTYDSTYGTFRSEEETLVTAYIPSAAAELPWTMLIILVVIMIGLVVGIAAVLRR